jgi:tRNA U34 5-carboxymethylaminomethyl modifying enzyme MnmG/GidA
MRNEQFNQIKQDLTNGVQYENYVANWYSVINVEQNRFMLNINDEIKFYKNLDSVAKKINQLLNKGA